MPNESAKTRPTKKQRELLSFVEKFVGEHGYGPSYREIMTGCNYSSVATVALHVKNLIKRGHLQKNGRHARSLEVVEVGDVIGSGTKLPTNKVTPGEEKWLVEKIDYRFKQAENSESIAKVELDSLYVLVGALKVLGLDGAANSFVVRLNLLKKRTVN